MIPARFRPWRASSAFGAATSTRTCSHAVRSAMSAGHRVEVIPARCKDCGFVFGPDRLSKPGRCPSCKGSRLFEPLIRLADAAT